ncbi:MULTISPECIES: hypothetical protein [unclassified Streptomyces]|uniref:hypothetical protein n=1 Tax=unclassified Streptomyces TaxID=2593676 RepID=UPI00343AC8EF
MTRIQILELPEGAGDRQPPFVVVLDKLTEFSPFNTRGGVAEFGEVAKAWGARGVLVTTDTVEIPSNEVPLGPDGYPVRLAVEADLDGFRDQVAEHIAAARSLATEGGS